MIYQTWLLGFLNYSKSVVHGEVGRSTDALTGTLPRRTRLPVSKGHSTSFDTVLVASDLLILRDRGSCVDGLWKVTGAPYTLNAYPGIGSV